MDPTDQSPPTAAEQSPAIEPASESTTNIIADASASIASDFSHEVGLQSSAPAIAQLQDQVAEMLATVDAYCAALTTVRDANLISLTKVLPKLAATAIDMECVFDRADAIETALDEMEATLSALEATHARAQLDLDPPPASKSPLAAPLANVTSFFKKRLPFLAATAAVVQSPAPAEEKAIAHYKPVRIPEFSQLLSLDSKSEARP